VDNRCSWPFPGHRRKSPLSLSAYWFSGLLSPGRIARQRLTESRHDSVVCAVEGISLSTPPSAPTQDSAGRRSINWLYLLHHGIVICQGRPDFAGGSPDSGEHRRTNAQKFDSLASGNSPALSAPPDGFATIPCRCAFISAHCRSNTSGFFITFFTNFHKVNWSCRTSSCSGQRKTIFRAPAVNRALPVPAIRPSR
jgi:hypothetical protein